MLTHLAIKDLVIIHALSLDLSSGMTAMTGETGAGKSIMVDALDLALGGKADKRIIRNQCASAEITASFDLSNNPAAQQWMLKHDLNADDECILHRILLQEGRARAYVNNRPVPLQQLRELGDLLIDIHGQHQHQSLLRVSSQRRLLDNYANNATLLKKVNASYKIWKKTEIELEEMQANAATRLSRLDYVQYQLLEVEGLDLSPAHLKELDSAQTRLAHAEELGTELDDVIEQIYESDTAVHPLLSNALTKIQALTGINPELGNSVALLEEARIQIEEAVTLLREQADTVELEPAKLATIETELSQIHNLGRKHNLRPAQLLSYFDNLQNELETLQNFDGSVDNLRVTLDEQAANYNKAATKLTRARKKAASSLSKTVTESMQELGLQGGEFEITINPIQQTVAGHDEIEFLVAANPGQAMASLAQTASGGELSRISLAIQVATAGCGEVPTLIYDEVDVGIGGSVATKVGRLLRGLGDNRQVLVVTHLAQVAAHANAHLQVDKNITKGNTETRVIPLNPNDRISEIARMLGSENITEQSLAHADEMIQQAS